MNHLMIDIETLSLEPNAVVFQIGAVVFDMSGNINSEAIYHVDILPQIMKGRHFDPETQKWWMQQDPSAWWRQLLNTNTVEFAIFGINDLHEQYQCSSVWANSPSFDCVTLRSLAKDFGTELRWDFRSEMDLRSLKKISSVLGFRESESVKATHNAVKDCVDQVKKVAFYWNNIVGLEKPTIVTPGG